MYAEEVNCLLPYPAECMGLRGGAEGIDRVELNSEQSDITPYAMRAIGVVTARLTVTSQWPPTW